MAWLKTIRQLVIFVFMGILMYACLEPFDADVSVSKLDILIIDGYINIGAGETQITLSKVSALDEADAIEYAQGAEVYIENEGGEAFVLNESADGRYKSGELSLSADNRYRIYIKLPNGKEYRSALLAPKITPPIDSIHWEYKPDLLYIYANSHDPAGASRYYRWSYQEDWQIKSQFKADLEYRPGETPLIQERPDPFMLAMHDCWKKSISNRLIFGSTALQRDDNIKFPVITIPHSGERTSVKYSAIVNQHTLTEDEFNYLTLMNKNTTQTGSFFDPMPSQLFGNINRINHPNETVIGYVGVYTTEQDTLFILEAELPPGDEYQFNCMTIQFPLTAENCEIYLGGSSPPYIPYQLYSVNGNPEDLMVVAMVTKDCMDCRSNFTGQRPDYW